MLAELAVENLAIIPSAVLSFRDGLTALTGETGAGKSLVLDALELVLGGRADGDLIRSGCSSASVQAVFDLRSRPDLEAQCGALGFSTDEGMLFVHRELLSTGRSQSKVNGRLVPVTILRQLGKCLVDMHTQHDSHGLLDPTQYMRLLDSWIGGPLPELKQELGAAIERRNEAAEAYSALKRALQGKEERLDTLGTQIKELEGVEIRVGELDELAQSLDRFCHAEKLVVACNGALEAIQNRPGNALDSLSEAVHALESILKFDNQVLPVLECLRTARTEIQEAGYDISKYVAANDLDPDRLEELAARRDTLKRICRKYGEDEAGLLRILEAFKLEIEQLVDGEYSLEMNEKLLAELNKEVHAKAAEITKLRADNAPNFAEAIRQELVDLTLEHAVFSCLLSSIEPNANGADELIFLFSANPGEPPRALNKIASGGELSRVMLAIKAALADKAGVATLIFDEVDTGLSGRAAAAMGRKLQELGEHYQVITITHLPQIASRAKYQFRIEKESFDDRTITSIKELSPEARREEIARLMSGDDLQKEALDAAARMLSLGVSA